ncbi:MAG TPA: hypothetical protein VFW33_21815 [Gemmataceae bacterium]|nr:hypothetical protein [Gemmataceae bacterium]
MSVKTKSRQRRPAAPPAEKSRRSAFINETWAATNVHRRFAWALIGERLVCAVPHVH